MAIPGESCNVDANAKIPALFMTMLCPRLCVHTDSECTVVFPIRASHPSRRHHHTHHTHTQSQMLSLGSSTKKERGLKNLFPRGSQESGEDNHS